MAQVPGGTRVSPGEVVWRAGGVTLRVSASARVPLTGSASASAAQNPNCPANDFCAWSETNFTGTCVVVMDPGTGDFFDWAAFSGDHCGSRGTWSWANNSPDRVWKHQSYSGGTPLGNYFYTGGGTVSGNTWCISPGVSNPDVTDNATRTDGWIQMTTNTSSC